MCLISVWHQVKWINSISFAFFEISLWGVEVWQNRLPSGRKHENKTETDEDFNEMFCSLQTPDVAHWLAFMLETWKHTVSQTSAWQKWQNVQWKVLPSISKLRCFMIHLKGLFMLLSRPVAKKYIIQNRDGKTYFQTYCNSRFISCISYLLPPTITLSFYY